MDRCPRALAGGACRGELIANALDEHHLSGTAEPVIAKVGDGCWEIRDFGRGLRYEHLTQNENPDKLVHPQVIGQFGIGLKDALAVFDRHDVGVTIRSCHGVITTGRRSKAGFPDVVTLHGIVEESAEPEMVGTSILLSGISDADVAAAQSNFRRYSRDVVLEETKYGVVLERPAKGAASARLRRRSSSS